jgi:RHS repeat-associated protein
VSFAEDQHPVGDLGPGAEHETGAGTAYSFELGDQHGTSLLTLDNTAANPVWRQYTPYGAARGTAPSSWPDINAFLGKPADTATGLDLLGARQYDPATGRFLSVDPVLDPASPQTLNGYGYAAGNPVTQADPTGLCIYSWCPPPPAHGTAPPSKYGPGSGGGGDGYNPAPSPGTGCQNSPTGCFPGSAGPIGEQPSGPGAPPPPDLHPVAASYTSSGSAVGSVNTPGCNGFLFKYGACPSESGAAGTTPQEVRQSAIGAAGILLGAFPIGDIFDAAGIGSWLSRLLSPKITVYDAEDAGAAASDLPGYSSFRAAKADLGSAGPGNVFDHVVERSQIARSGFAPEEVHNPFNLDPVPSGVNQLKANYYSSIRPFTGGMTVRGWLTGQSFADQYEFGMDTLMHLTNGSPLP